MKSCRFYLLLHALILLTSCKAVVIPSDAYPLPIEGTWEGAFVASSPAADGSSLTSDIALRLEIKKDQARVSNFENGIWREIEPNRFKFVSLKTNALVYLMHEGKVPTPNGSRWVETYLLSITLQDESTLLGRWVRVVNNIDIPKDNSERAFTVDGEFRMTKGLRAR